MINPAFFRRAFIPPVCWKSSRVLGGRQRFAVQMESVRWMIDLALRAGVQRIVLNGSFVTNIVEPNDVDCVLLFPHGRRRDRDALRQLRAGLPFLDMKLVGQSDFDEFVNVTFATDRLGSPKGMIEVGP
jgi:hypothetical protein